MSLQFREQRASELSSVIDYLKTTAGLNAAYKHNNPTVNNSNLDSNNRLDSMGIDSLEGKDKGFHGEVGHIQEIGKVSGVENITNDVLESPRTGSALKSDQYHAFNDIIDNSASRATKTNLGNNATSYQLDGSLNGTAGRFEWIIQNGQITYRMFVPNGMMNGVPIVK